MSSPPSSGEAGTSSEELAEALSRMAIVAGGCAGSCPSPPAPRRPRPLLVGEAQGRVRLLQSAAATVGELKDELEEENAFLKLREASRHWRELGVDEAALS